MKRHLLPILFVLALLTGCSSSVAKTDTSKTSTGPDNSMTRYADTLHSDVGIARNAADKANAAIEAEQNAAKETLADNNQ